jgi:hypothetical protein
VILPFHKETLQGGENKILPTHWMLSKMLRHRPLQKKMNKQFKIQNFLLWAQHLKLPIMPTVFCLPTYLQRKGPFKTLHPPRMAVVQNTHSQALLKPGKEKAKEIFWHLPDFRNFTKILPIST